MMVECQCPVHPVVTGKDGTVWSRFSGPSVAAGGGGLHPLHGGPYAYPSSSVEDSTPCPSSVVDPTPWPSSSLENPTPCPSSSVENPTPAPHHPWWTPLPPLHHPWWTTPPAPHHPGLEIGGVVHQGGMTQGWSMGRARWHTCLQTSVSRAHVTPGPEFTCLMNSSVFRLNGY